VDDEGVLQVLHGALHPVVEGCRPLGELQVQLVDGLQELLGSLSAHTRAEPASNGLQTGFRPASTWLQTDFKPASNQLHSLVKPASNQLQTGFKPASTWLQPSLKTA